MTGGHTFGAATAAALDDDQYRALRQLERGGCQREGGYSVPERMNGNSLAAMDDTRPD